MALRLASTNAKRIPLDDGDWIEVREEISKGAFKQIMKLMPQKEINTDGAAGGKVKMSLTQGDAVEYQTALFGALVIGWSLEGTEPTVANYELLENDAASGIDAALGEHFSAIQPSKAEAGKRSTSRA